MRLIGVVHLPALPGSPRSTLSLDAVIEHAVTDARALAEGGADGIIVENFNDVPFFPDTVPPHTVAAMTAACIAVRREVSLPIGVNVLRNDAAAALGIALAAGCHFIRVNVHTGTMVTDQGIINARAAETLRLRREIGADHVEVFADVLVKHAVPLGPVSLTEAVRDAVERGMANAVVITGSATGAPASPEDVRTAAGATSVPVYVGSGVTAENVREFVPEAHGVIVGSWLKRNGAVANPVDPERVHRLVSELAR